MAVFFDSMEPGGQDRIHAVYDWVVYQRMLELAATDGESPLLWGVLAYVGTAGCWQMWRLRATPAGNNKPSMESALYRLAHSARLTIFLPSFLPSSIPSWWVSSGACS